MQCPIAELVGEEAAWYIRVSILVLYLFLGPMPSCISQLRHDLRSGTIIIALICLNILPYYDTIWKLVTPTISSFFHAVVVNMWVFVLVTGVCVITSRFLASIKSKDQPEATNGTNTKDQQPSAATEGSRVEGATPNCGSAHKDSRRECTCCCSVTRQQVQSLFREILLEEKLEWSQKVANKPTVNTTAAQQPTPIEREYNEAAQQENCLQQEMQKLRKETKKQTELLSNYLEFIFDEFESESVKETSPEIIMDEAEQKQQLNGQLDGQLEVEVPMADANTEGCGEGLSDKDKCHDCNIVSHSTVESECHAADGYVTAADADVVDTSPLIFCTWKSPLARRARATAAAARNHPASRNRAPSFSPWKNFARRKQKLSQDRQKRLFQP